jgi:UDP-N-acetylglucosamine 2-epimerase
MKRIAIVLGTRPEAIKFASVVHLLRLLETQGLVSLRVYSTGQHREMLRPVFDFFGYEPDVDLDIMQKGQSLNGVAAAVMARLEPVLAAERWDWVLVQGDTTTAAAAAWCASNLEYKVAHLEAGLRTGNRRNPFPEETNRRIVSAVAELHFAPTPHAREALLREGIADSAVLVTGNTVIDALLWARERVVSGASALAAELLDIAATSRRVVLVTGHRRESFGDGFDSICRAIGQLAATHPDTLFVYPVHLNPRVREPVFNLLSNRENVRLIPPLNYPNFVWLLNRSYLVLTDSGGVQEEAPSLGKPVLVMRETTERPEGVAAGGARLVGVESSRIVENVSCLLNDVEAYGAMAVAKNPYGDGLAAERIVNALRH